MEPFQEVKRIALHIESITTREAVQGCRERWEKLCAALSCSVPYMTHEWYANALGSIDGDKEPMLVFFQKDGKDVGMAPLVRKEKRIAGIRLNRIGFVDNPYTPNQLILGDIEPAELYGALTAHLEEKLGTWFYLDLDEMRLTPELLEKVKSLEKQGLSLVECEEKMSSRYLILQAGFEETLHVLDKHAQREFKRKINRMGRLGAMGLEVISGPDAIRDHLDTFFAMYARTWKGAEPCPEFYHRLCRDFEARGELFFTALTVNGRPVAYLISIRSGDTMYGIKTTYDPSYYAFSPGIILFYKSIEKMFEIPGLREFDIGRGDEQFKREWTPLVHEQWRVRLFPPTLPWRAVALLKTGVLPALRKNEAFMAAYKKLRKIVLNDGGDPRDAAEAVGEKPRARYARQQGLPAPVGMSARYAAGKDLELLTVAMASPNFAEIKGLLDASQCLLLFENERLAGYFWLLNTDGQGALKNGACSMDRWGLSKAVTGSGRENECVQALMAHLSRESAVNECVLSYERMENHCFDI